MSIQEIEHLLPFVLNPKNIDKPVIVKYHGAKGGKGFFIAKTYDEFEKRIDLPRDLLI